MLRIRFHDLPIGDHALACVQLAKFGKRIKNATTLADVVNLAAEETLRTMDSSKLAPRSIFMTVAQTYFDPATYRQALAKSASPSTKPDRDRFNPPWESNGFKPPKLTRAEVEEGDTFGAQERREAAKDLENVRARIAAREAAKS